MKKTIVPTSIRLDENLFNRIRNEAEKEKRSITAQIEYNLEKYYEMVDLIKSPAEKVEKNAM